jgi:diguanylate cyclase (GGDEF)-like protein
VLLDLDEFKRVNDTHGHEAGDEAIRTLARVLQQGTRGIDLAARIGGEEFAVILTETNLAGATEVAERLRLTLRTTEIPPIGQIAASFGVAECPSQATTARELLASADAALYQAKREGRDRVVPASEAKSNSFEVGSVQG